MVENFRTAPNSRCKVTSAVAPATHCTVRGLFSFVAGMLLLVALGIGSLAHAAEPIGCIDTSASGAAIGHMDGDADQVPADGDQGYPHHHGGCHGHHIAAPVTKTSAIGHFTERDVMPSPSSRALPNAASDPALRPPQA